MVQNTTIAWMNSTENGNGSQPLYIGGGVSRTSTYILIASYAVLMPIIITGNILVILSYIKFERMKTVTHMLICSLAVSDIIVGVFAIPLYIMVKLVPPILLDGKLRHALMRKLICIPWITSYLFPTAVSVMTLLAIATTLLISIKWPFKFSTMVTHCRARIIIFCIWIYILGLGMPMLVWNNNKDGKLCQMENFPGQYFKPVIISHVSIPYGIMVVMYAFIHQKIKKINKRTITRQVGRTSSNQRQGVKIANFMSIAIVLFLICWIPVLVMYPMAGFFRGSEHFNVAYYYATWLMFANSAFNPILYSTKNRDYRTAFKYLLGQSRLKYTPSDSYTSRTSMKKNIQSQ